MSIPSGATMIRSRRRAGRVSRLGVGAARVETSLESNRHGQRNYPSGGRKRSNDVQNMHDRSSDALGRPARPMLARTRRECIYDTSMTFTKRDEDIQRGGWLPV